MTWAQRIGHRLKLRDLHILLTVVRSGSMGRAAIDLAVSQPAVSKAISDLEHTLGVRLLDRSSQGVEPTAYGQALLRCGIAVFDDLRRGVREIEFLADPSAGELSLGCTEPLAAGFVSVVIDHLSQCHPKARFQVVSADPVMLLNRDLRQRQIELALAPATGLTLHEETQFDFLFDDRHVILVGEKSQWARRRNIVLADLIEHPWVLPSPDTPVGLHIGDAFRAAGLEPPRARVLTFSIPMHQHLLATGRFITTLPVSMLHHAKHLPLRLLPVKFPAHPRPIGIVTLRNRTLSPLAQHFVELAHKLAKKLPGVQ
jgi:DNA-binding transcriptional LysR family regulator